MLNLKCQNQILNLKTKKVRNLVFLVIVLSFAFLVLSLSGANAQSPTQEEATPSSLGAKDVRKEIKDIVSKQIKEAQKRAFAGEITAISDSALTLTVRKEQKQVKVDETTKIINKNRQEVSLKDLQVGNFIIAMGFIGDGGVLGAKRIVVVEKPKVPARQVAFGKVTDISIEERILTVKNEKKSLVYTIEVNDVTRITKKVNEKVVIANFSDIKKGDRVVAIGKPVGNEGKTIDAKIIHIIPGKAEGQEKPTPSSTP